MVADSSDSLWILKQFVTINKVANCYDSQDSCKLKEGLNCQHKLKKKVSNVIRELWNVSESFYLSFVKFSECFQKVSKKLSEITTKVAK